MSIDIGEGFKVSIEEKLKARHDKELATARARSKAFYAKNKEKVKAEWKSPHNTKTCTTTERECLKCAKNFNSKSKQNRICYDCKQSSEYLAHYDMGEIMEQ